MRVLCTLPNASEWISGIHFDKTPEGMLSEEIDAATAATFTVIRGYSLSDEEPVGTETDLTPPETDPALPETEPTPPATEPAARTDPASQPKTRRTRR